MAINLNAVLARKHGEVNGYAVIASFSDYLPIARKFEEITDPVKGADFRAQHAEVELWRGSNLQRTLRFPNPAAVEADRKKRLLDNALAIFNRGAAAEKQIAVAEASAKSVEDQLAALDPESQALLKEHLEAQAAAKAKAEADAKAAAQVTSQQAAAREQNAAQIAAAEQLRIAAAQAETAALNAVTAQPGSTSAGSPAPGAPTEPHAPSTEASAPAPADVEGPTLLLTPEPAPDAKADKKAK